MQHTTVQSTSIAVIAHDATTSVLEIEFTNGSRYRYFLVPQRVHAAFLRSPSKGTFFNKFIRSTYTFARV